MEIVIGYAKSDSQVAIQEINTSTDETQFKIIDRDHIADTPLNVLISPSAEWVEGYNLKNEMGFYPVLSNTAVNMSFDKFESSAGNELSSFYQKQIHSWTLKNNLQTIEDLYSFTTHMKNLWSGDRMSFFEELWSFFKKNLATHDLKILFNDVEEIQGKEGAVSAKLIQSVIEGKKNYQIRRAHEQEIKVMDHFKGRYSETLNFETLDMEKGEMVSLIQIEESPLIIMAKISSFNEIQKSILNGMFKGLQS